MKEQGGRHEGAARIAGDRPAVQTCRIAVLRPEAFPSVEAWAGEVARITREAFRAPGRAVEGLPGPGGAHESAADVLKDLQRGGRVWVARVPSGQAVGTVRAIPAGSGVWELKRLGVAPHARGHGIARRLVRRVEREALRAGIRAVRLHCVVERLLPPFYARLGYRTVGRWPHADKPLTVVAMERDLLSRRRPYRDPWQAEEALPDAGLYVLWVWLPQAARLPMPGPATLPPGLYAYVGSAQRGLAARLGRHVRGVGRLRWHIDHLRRHARVVGVDVWPGALRHEECHLAEAVAHASSSNSALVRPRGFGASDCGCPGHLIYLGLDPYRATPFVMPRQLNRELLAVIRLPLSPQAVPTRF